MSKNKTDLEIEKSISSTIKKIEDLGLHVRREKLTKGSGFRVRSGQCFLENENCFFVDKNLTLKAQLELIYDEYTRLSQVQAN